MLLGLVTRDSGWMAHLRATLGLVQADPRLLDPRWLIPPRRRPSCSPASCTYALTGVRHNGRACVSPSSMRLLSTP